MAVLVRWRRPARSESEREGGGGLELGGGGEEAARSGVAGGAGSGEWGEVWTPGSGHGRRGPPLHGGEGNQEVGCSVSEAIRHFLALGGDGVVHGALDGVEEGRREGAVPVTEPPCLVPHYNDQNLEY